jgi:hypothetical protein
MAINGTNKQPLHNQALLSTTSPIKVGSRQKKQKQ